MHEHLLQSAFRSSRGCGKLPSVEAFDDCRSVELGYQSQAAKKFDFADSTVLGLSSPSNKTGCTHTCNACSLYKSTW